MSTYIQPVPLPSLRACINFTEKNPGVSWSAGGRNIIRFFSRGSQALAEVAQVAARGAKDSVWFFPAYFCEASLGQLRRTGARIVFYRVTNELTPNWDDVRKHAKVAHPDVFVLVHLFGRIQDASEALVFAKEEGCTVLEDAAHVLRPGGALCCNDTIVLFSPHKLLALPPISLITVPPSLGGLLGDERKLAWRKQDLKWLAKRLVQRGILTFGGLGMKCKPRAGGFGGGESNELSIYDQASEVSAMGSYLLQSEEANLPEVVARRKKNFNRLARALETLPDAAVPKPFAEPDETSTPYAFPFFVGEERVARVYSALWNLGIPAQTWPDLPPEVRAQPEIYSEACHWRNNLLLLPVHQSLTDRQMKQMIAGLHVVLSREK